MDSDQFCSRARLLPPKKKKTAAIFPEEYEVDCKSSLLSFDDHPVTKWLSLSISFSRSKSFSSANMNSFFDGSSINPIKEASLLLEKIPNHIVFHEDLEQVVTWLFKSTWSAESQYQYKNFSHYNHNDFLSKNLSEAAELDDFDDDEPLFWPSENKLTWNSEVLFDCFSISPRRIGNQIEKSEKFCGSKSVILRLHSRKFKAPKDKLFNSTNEESTRKDNELISDYRDLLEECFLSNEDVAIEALVGLDEFNGHEGVHEEFNEESFFLGY